jgi:hypothetical protein
MEKIIFPPIGIIAGLASGLVASRVFELIWQMIDDEDAPEPKHKEVPIAKTVIALVIQGAIFKLVRGLVDHQVRRGFERWSGVWPGEERPEPK